MLINIKRIVDITELCEPMVYSIDEGYSAIQIHEMSCQSTGIFCIHSALIDKKIKIIRK